MGRWPGEAFLFVSFLRIQAGTRPIIYCFPFRGIFVCARESLCSFVVDSSPVKNVTRSVQVLL